MINKIAEGCGDHMFIVVTLHYDGRRHKLTRGCDYMIQPLAKHILQICVNIYDNRSMLITHDANS